MNTLRILTVLTILSITPSLYPDKLKSSIINILDGVSYGMDGETLYSITWLIGQYDSMLNGKVIDKATKKREGIFTLRGVKCTAKDLVEYEKSSNDAQTHQELDKLLHIEKDRFIDLNKAFIKSVQGNKPLILKLMHESCTLHGTPESFMLKWADTPFGQEQESFDKNMPSHAVFTTFLVELVNFLGDLYESCPKGRAQYLELLKKQRAQVKTGA